MLITDESMQYTAFITFQGVYKGPGSQWQTIGKLFSKDDGWVCTVHGLIFIIFEVYIDEQLIYGRTEEEFFRNVETVFERLREYNTRYRFRGHQYVTETCLEYHWCDMTHQAKGAIIFNRFSKLFSRPHSTPTVAKPLTQMVSVENQSKTKSILWIDAGVHAFQVLKDLVNVCPKLLHRLINRI